MEPSSPSHQTAHVTVPPNWEGKRLDMFLVSQLPSFSRSQIQNLIKNGNIIPQFPVKSLKTGLVVSPGQVFQVDVPATQMTHLQAQSIPLDIPFEDDHLLVINKPAGLVVHPGAGNPDRTPLMPWFPTAPTS